MSYINLIQLKLSLKNAFFLRVLWITGINLGSNLTCLNCLKFYAKLTFCFLSLTPSNQTIKLQLRALENNMFP